MPFSTYAATSYGGVFVGSSITAPAGMYLALHTGNPTSAGTALELSGGNYIRKQVQFSAANGLNGRELTNSNAVVFPAGSADLGQVTWFTVWDAESGGNCWYVGQLEAPSNWEVGVSVALAVGVLKITVLIKSCTL